MQNLLKLSLSNTLTQNTISLNTNHFKKQHLSSALQISLALQSTIELYELMKQFHFELKKIFSYQSFLYLHSDLKQKFEIGKLQTYQAHYLLKIDDHALGELTISKRSPFSNNEIQKLEDTLVYLLMPLRNAIRYETVISMSMVDPFLGLLNRQSLDMALKREVAFAKRHRTDLSLLVIDIDFFKLINDSFGHLAGDQILIEFSKRLKKLHRQTDMIFRYGGEEFVILLPRTDLKGSVQVAERVCLKTAEKPFPLAKKMIPITVSIGVATHVGTENSEHFFTRADGALYTAKSKGRNQVSIVEN